MSNKDIAVQMAELLDEVDKRIENTIETAFRDEAKKTASTLKNTSPKRSGAYARSWTMKKTADKTYTVYNKDHYQLTHLLENGHVVRNKKGTYGRAPAHPHIGPAQEKAAEDVVILISRSLD